MGKQNYSNQSDNNLRASGGFGIKYYSPIGPLAFHGAFLD